MEYDKFISGKFTATGNAYTLDLPFAPDYFEVVNQTTANSTANPGVMKRAWAYSDEADGAAYLVKNTNSAATDESSRVTSNGFTFITKDTPQFGPVLTGTGISQASPAVVTINSHGLVTGDVVLIYGTTGMYQVAGMYYTVTRINANTFSIPVDSSGFSAAATAVKAKKVLYPDLYEPYLCYITACTAATSAVITTSLNHSFVVGQEVSVNIPANWGMVEMANKRGFVTAITSSTITVDIDSSGFTAFAYPTSAVATAGIQFPTVIGIGETYNVLSGAFRTNTSYGVYLGTSVCGAASDVIYWKAQKYARNEV